MSNNKANLVFADPQKSAQAATLLPSISGYSVTLEPINADNQALLYVWRNQANIRQYMVNQQTISKAEHNAWFAALADKTDQQYFVIYYKNQAIGAINIKCHDGLPLKTSRHAEIGLYIGADEYRNNIVAFAPSLVITDYAFYHLGIKKLSSKVKADNSAALKYNQQLGYLLDIDNSAKSHAEFIAITLTLDGYEQHNQTLKKFLARGTPRVN